MQRFEITVDGRIVGRDYATQHEAEEAAILTRQQNEGRTVDVRAKGDEKGKPAVNENGIVIGNGQTQETASVAEKPASPAVTGRVDTAPAQTAHLEAGTRPSSYPRR